VATIPRPATAPSELTVEEARALFDKLAQVYVQMSGDEFIRRYRAGELPEDNPRVDHLILLLPLAG
jgi:hypothetical protein